MFSLEVSESPSAVLGANIYPPAACFRAGESHVMSLEGVATPASLPELRHGARTDRLWAVKRKRQTS